MPTDPGSVVEEEDADERTKGGKAGKGGASVVKEPQARKKQKQEGAPGADGQFDPLRNLDVLAAAALAQADVDGPPGVPAVPGTGGPGGSPPGSKPRPTPATTSAGGAAPLGASAAGHGHAPAGGTGGGQTPTARLKTASVSSGAAHTAGGMSSAEPAMQSAPTHSVVGASAFQQTPQAAPVQPVDDVAAAGPPTASTVGLSAAVPTKPRSRRPLPPHIANQRAGHGAHEAGQGADEGPGALGEAGQDAMLATEGMVLESGSGELPPDDQLGLHGQQAAGQAQAPTQAQQAAPAQGAAQPQAAPGAHLQPQGPIGAPTVAAPVHVHGTAGGAAAHTATHAVEQGTSGLASAPLTAPPAEAALEEGPAAQSAAGLVVSLLHAAGAVPPAGPMLGPAVSSAAAAFPLHPPSHTALQGQQQAGAAHDATEQATGSLPTVHAPDPAAHTHVPQPQQGPLGVHAAAATVASAAQAQALQHLAMLGGDGSAGTSIAATSHSLGPLQPPPHSSGSQHDGGALATMQPLAAPVGPASAAVSGLPGLEGLPDPVMAASLITAALNSDASMGAGLGGSGGANLGLGMAALGGQSAYASDALSQLLFAAGASSLSASMAAAAAQLPPDGLAAALGPGGLMAAVAGMGMGMGMGLGAELGGQGALDEGTAGEAKRGSGRKRTATGGSGTEDEDEATDEEGNSRKREGRAAKSASQRRYYEPSMKVTFEEGMKLADGRIYVPLPFVHKNFQDTTFPLKLGADIVVNGETISENYQVKVARSQNKTRRHGLGNHWVTGHQRLIRNYKDVRLMGLELINKERLRIILSASGLWDEQGGAPQGGMLMGAVGTGAAPGGLQGLNSALLGGALAGTAPAFGQPGMAGLLGPKPDGSLMAAPPGLDLTTLLAMQAAAASSNPALPGGGGLAGTNPTTFLAMMLGASTGAQQQQQQLAPGSGAPAAGAAGGLPALAGPGLPQEAQPGTARTSGGGAVGGGILPESLRQHLGLAVPQLGDEGKPAGEDAGVAAPSDVVAQAEAGASASAPAQDTNQAAAHTAAAPLGVMGSAVDSHAPAVASHEQPDAPGPSEHAQGPSADSLAGTQPPAGVQAVTDAATAGQPTVWPHGLEMTPGQPAQPPEQPMLFTSMLQQPHAGAAQEQQHAVPSMEPGPVPAQGQAQPQAQPPPQTHAADGLQGQAGGQDVAGQNANTLSAMSAMQALMAPGAPGSGASAFGAQGVGTGGQLPLGPNLLLPLMGGQAAGGQDAVAAAAAAAAGLPLALAGMPLGAELIAAAASNGQWGLDALQSLLAPNMGGLFGLGRPPPLAQPPPTTLSSATAGAQQHPRLYDGRIHVPLNIITAHFNNQEFPVPIYTKVIINNEVVGDNVQARIVKYKKHKRPNHFNFWITGLQKTLAKFNDVRQAGVQMEPNGQVLVRLVAANGP